MAIFGGPDFAIEDQQNAWKGQEGNEDPDDKNIDTNQQTTAEEKDIASQLHIEDRS